MGLPQISITFTSLAASAVTRSARGVVALILRDATAGDTVNEYSVVTEVESNDWTATNLQYIKQAFLSTPSKVIVVRGATADEDYSDQLSVLANKRWNYLAIPDIESADVSDVASWLKSQRDMSNKTFKAVLPNHDGDHEGIINFTTNGIVVAGTTHSASQYTARIAGVLAGLPLTRSATFYELSEVESITESATPDADIDNGELILINDGEKVKIGRGVNSLTTVTGGKSADWKKIKVIEGHDIIKEDVTRTFNDNYVGRVLNSYDNQVLFLTSVNSYLQQLGGTVLDSTSNNRVDVDVEAQRAAWTGIGTDVSQLTDEQIKEKSFQDKVFVSGNLKFLDAMEDLQFKAYV
ncbi:phage tail sheath C-terminal domain-containing protein [Paenibacillus sp. J5C2022]|uniref:phage tail sheath C-terminal domain-containing protein n=1 Tax=Paenibacillus sp. J5C2022 TaxID=2977129 RepID=UPI0021CE298F|nr:phage tail sheath C-terminal domain-containing protein [Paenibacillus sp. J5C2022]